MIGHAFIFDSKFAKIRRMHKNDWFNFFSASRAQKLLEQSLWARQYGAWKEWWLEREEDRTVFRLPVVLHLCSYLQASHLCSARSRNSTCNIAWVFVSFQNAQVTHWLTDCVSDWWLGGWIFLSIATSARHGRWSVNGRKKNRQREMETVIKQQQVNRRSIARLCWSAVSGGSR